MKDCLVDASLNLKPSVKESCPHGWVNWATVVKGQSAPIENPLRGQEERLLLSRSGQVAARQE